MLRFSSHEIGILSGEALLVSDFDNNGPMWNEDGDRIARHYVAFSERFIAPPVVHLGISMWDADTGSNLRGDLRVEDITLNGFHIVFQTWSDTRIARMRVSWMAIGAVPDEQDFIL